MTKEVFEDKNIAADAGNVESMSALYDHLRLMQLNGDTNSRFRAMILLGFTNAMERLQELPSTDEKVDALMGMFQACAEGLANAIGGEPRHVRPSLASVMAAAIVRAFRRHPLMKSIAEAMPAFMHLASLQDEGDVTSQAFLNICQRFGLGKMPFPDAKAAPKGHALDAEKAPPAEPAGNSDWVHGDNFLVHMPKSDTPRIEQIFAFLSQDESGEGIVAQKIGDEWLALVCGDQKRVPLMEAMAQQLATASKKRITLVKFKSRREVKVIEP